MNISAPLKGIITNDTNAFALVSDRVFPTLAPQRTAFPLIVITTVNVAPEGTKNAPSKIDNVAVQIDCYGDTYAAAANTAEAVRRAIDYYRGNVEYMSVTYAVDFITFQRGRETIDPDTEKYRYIAEYKVRMSRFAIFEGDVIPATGLQYYASDLEAATAGLEVGDWYLLNWSNIYGMAGDMPKKVTSLTN
jgi:hypothetical protein